MRDKELPWYAFRQAPEQELKCLRGLGVYEKVDERDAGTRYQVTPSTRSGAIRTFHSRAYSWHESSKVEIDPTCMR